MAPNTVRAWRRGFEAGGLEWLGTVVGGRGPARSLSAEAEAAIAADTLYEQPPDGSAAGRRGPWRTAGAWEKDIVARIWRERGLRPWRTDVFKLSQDPDFEAKLCDVIGLYLDPPERAAVFSFDEKTQIQALDRTQPSLPMKRGRAQTMTHDYKRNGTLDLFAALNVATGEVLHQTAAATPAPTCSRSSSGSTCTHPATSTSTSSWTTCPPTSPNPSANGSNTPTANAGTSTSPPPAQAGPTSSSPGSPYSPAKPSKDGPSPPSPNSTTP